MYRIQLDNQKALKLRSVINADNYAYKYNIKDYYKICTIMDRLEDVVDVLNNLELIPSISLRMADTFIAWLNFADLLINCIQTLNTMYVVPSGTTFFRDDSVPMHSSLKGKSKIYFTDFCKTTGTDDLFFKYLRSLVLAHAIESDACKFNCFRKGTVTYTPLVRWNAANNIDIISYCPVNSSSKLNSDLIELEIKPLFDYVKNRYGYLDKIIKFIEKTKDKEKSDLCLAFSHNFQNVPIDCKPKIMFIKEVYNTLGDIDAKNDADLLSNCLKRVLDIVGYHYSEINHDSYQKYIQMVDTLLDEVMDNLKNQTIENIKLANLFCAPLNFHEQVFVDCLYEINKIIGEYDYIWEYNGFEDLFEKVKASVLQYVVIVDDMSAEEKTYLCVIARGLDIMNSIFG